jgi:uncharacterized protein (UPF0276 family)
MTGASAMEQRGVMTTTHASPVLAATYEGGDVLLLERLLERVGYIEITPDTIARRTAGGCEFRPEALAELESIGGRARLLVHGVGLSIGSYEGYSEAYLRLVDELFSRFDIAWHSEHLAYTTVGGENLGTMLAMPRTGEALDMICRRVCAIQKRYPAPFLLENVVHLLPDAPGEYSDAQFLNRIASRTGCGLILDVYNMECDALNYGFDVDGFLSELKLENVRELHLAGGTSNAGLQLDVHSRVTSASTLALAAHVLERASQVEAVTYEYLKEAVPSLGYDAICGELARISAELNL